METRWYLFDGQTLANTRIEDRGRALHVNAKLWGDIYKHLDRKQKIEQELVRQQNQKTLMKEKAEEMIKDWDNSVENIKKRKEETHRKKIEQVKEKRMNNYFKIRKEQLEMQEQYIKKIRRNIFVSTGHPKNLTSALVTSEILYERQKQIDLQKMLKEHEKEVKQKYTEKIEEDVEKWKGENVEAAKLVYEKNRKHSEFLKEIIAEKIAVEEHEKNRRKEKEAMDNQKATEEIEFLKQMELDETKLRKKMAMAGEKQRLKDQRARQKQLEKEDQRLNEIEYIQREEKFQTDCLRKRNQKALMADGVEKRTGMAEAMIAKYQEKQAHKRLIIENAMVQKSKLEVAKIRAEAEHVTKLQQERRRDHQAHLETVAENRKQEAELRKYELLKRYKHDQMIEDYDRKKKIAMQQQGIEYRNELFRQMDEVKNKVTKEKLEENLIVGRNYREDDEMFLEYADELLEQTRKTGRNPHPIKKVLGNYIKINHLAPKNIPNM